MKSFPILVALQTIQDLSRIVGPDGGAVGVKWEELLPKVDLDFVQPLLKYNELQKTMGDNKCSTCELKDQHLALAAKRMQARIIIPKVLWYSTLSFLHSCTHKRPAILPRCQVQLCFQLEQEAASLSESLNARSLDLYPDMRARQRVLKRFGLMQEDGTPTLKVCRLSRCVAGSSFIYLLLC